MNFDKEDYKLEFEKLQKRGEIKVSDATFRIPLYLKKGENSLLIAKYLKDIEPESQMPDKLYWNYWAITVAYYAMLYAAKAAIQSKGYKAENHFAVQIALGHLLVPNQIEKEDLQLLEQAHKIFEDEYVKYFEDARKESHIARYSAHKTYTEKRLDEIYDKARQFIAKIALILQSDQ